MTLKQLMEDFEALLTRNDAILADAPIVDIASGGLQQKGGQPPALCDSTELAVALWQRAARDYAKSQDGAEFKWIEPPTIDRWMITITDARVTHRLTSDRYVVFARIAVMPRP
jgi:hypothetical protein